MLLEEFSNFKLTKPENKKKHQHTAALKVVVLRSWSRDTWINTWRSQIEWFTRRGELKPASGNNGRQQVSNIMLLFKK